MSTRKASYFSNIKSFRWELLIVFLAFLLAAFCFGYLVGRNSVQDAVVETLRNDPIPEINAEMPKNEIPPADLQVVNINTADAVMLDILPGIGPALAEDIVVYRKAHGPFSKSEDLMKVPGIGEKKFEELKDWITVR